MYISNAVNLELDVPTWWNSAYDMLVRAYDLLKDVNMHVPYDEKLKNCTIVEQEWEKVKHLILVLKPLKTATTFLSVSTYITVSSTLPTYLAVLK